MGRRRRRDGEAAGFGFGVGGGGGKLSVLVGGGSGSESDVGSGWDVGSMGENDTSGVVADIIAPPVKGCISSKLGGGGKGSSS